VCKSVLDYRHRVSNQLQLKKYQKPTLYYNRKYLANAFCDKPFMTYLNCYMFRPRYVAVDVCHVLVTECLCWMKWSVRGAHTRGMRIACRVVVGNLKERDHLEDSAQMR